MVKKEYLSSGVLFFDEAKPHQILSDDTQPNSNISTPLYFRLAAGEFIRASVYPHYIIDSNTGTTPIEPDDVAFQITAWNYTVTRIGDL
jgi:hypothetical protein